MRAAYNLLDAHRAEKYVFKSFGHLSNTSLHIYSGLKFLEEDQNGFGKIVVANYKDIAEAGNVSKNSVGDGLTCLIESGLVKGEIGSQVKDDKRATTLTRVSIDDLKRNSPDKDGVAQKFADALNTRPFMFNGQTIKPSWNVGRTGRVCSSMPNIQGMKETERVGGLCAGFPAGYALVHADIKSAEPSVIKHVLGMTPDTDLYAAYMKAAVCDRPTAKKKVNMLAYCKNSLAIFAHWSEAARNDPVLSDYVTKLHSYKINLFEQSRKTRTVTTLTGRLIAAEEEKRVHAGRYFNWKIQGTVADIVNAAALELIDKPEVQTVVPLHDALYVVIAAGAKTQVEKLLCTEAQKVRVPLKVQASFKDSLAGMSTKTGTA